ncbi:FadR/GntR family transcriptional regulator [Salinibacterium sp. ZJ450]|uniref:FadR/GntR family transcriptional regulator n=1 Tax=Salinibacterium sp. ZJ450 TaxID=2708338 RepID=UPI00141FE634|nr:FCD domain-containing protein [Salinibacterium sp. ZJ450]
MSTDLMREPLTAQVHRAIISYIDQARLAPGDALPSTAALSERFNVSRPVIREALSALAALGLIELSNGRNAVVRRLDSHLVALFLSRAIRTSAEPLTTLMELRAPLEIEAALLAASKSTASQREDLVSLEKAMRDAMGDAKAYIELDLELHRQIAVISANPALLGVTEAVRGLVFESMIRLRAHREAEGLVGEEHAEHARIVEAIVAGEPDVAAEAMRVHMDRTAQLVHAVEAETASHMLRQPVI